MRNKDMPQYIADATDSNVYEYFTAEIHYVENYGKPYFEFVVYRTDDGKVATRKKINLMRGYENITFPVNISKQRLIEIMQKEKENEHHYHT